MASLFRSLSRSRGKSTSSQGSFTQVPTDINYTPLSHKPRLVVAASTPAFDPAILKRWRDEGFDVRYEYVQGDSKSATYAVESVGDALEDGETYAIVNL